MRLARVGTPTIPNPVIRALFICGLDLGPSSQFLIIQGTLILRTVGIYPAQGHKVPYSRLQPLRVGQSFRSTTGMVDTQTPIWADFAVCFSVLATYPAVPQLPLLSRAACR